MKKRVIYFDMLNIIASIAVVAMHCNAIVHTYSNTMAWKQSLLVEVGAYWAVPIFFMLTGAKLLDYRERYDTATFLKKHLFKVIVPWLCWCGIWFVYKTFIIKTITIDSARALFSTLYNGVVNNELQPVYWFFIPIIMIYLCMPVLSKLAHEKKLLWYMVFCIFVTVSIFQEVCAIFQMNYNNAFIYPLGAGYVLYVLLGYLIKDVELSRSRRWILYGLAVVSAIARYVTTFWYSIDTGELNHMLWGYTSATTVLFSVGVFYFFKNRRYQYIIEHENVLGVVKTLSSCSFGIYLVHKFVMDIVLRLLHIDAASLIWRTVWVFAIYSLSLVLVLGLKRVKFLSKILVP